ncbi:hypothetical protein LIS90_13270 [Flavobacterium psychrophilum]|uniref:hypothetical protein n=1 Tax=Flavobacterium psychrophilum TaxID=96345 RepID=UPI000B7C2779|nr:hypothetical protein [Flavobacterium psychrophilum]MCB6089600.1 hypothetical protein [Flavobacterium psychrophilum]MCB6232216.1 hypothetical protein [Flavobacterium psychrophilum]MEB3380594.1 hypothetical protein [Flavobacterium psychrophilum]SNA72380.1 hypothetical protein DK150_260002 [Flavobacterium psychrophilum]SNA87955.1 hypothetical protein FI146_690004 [Flavobacterium psychrophilum]
MKIIFIILLSLFLGNYLDCKTERYLRIDILKEKQEKKLIIGEWLMCNKIVDDAEISYNVCPEFYFLENGFGKVIKPSKVEIEFTYFLKDNNKVEFTSNSNQFDFENEEYFYKIYFENKIEVLQISSKTEKSKYILYRKIKY